MIFGISIYYFFIKIVFFFSLVRAQIKSDLLRDHFLFLAIIYTAAVAFLSYAFFVSWKGQIFPDRYLEVSVSQAVGLSWVTPWVAWLGLTLVLSAIYFKLMAKFDEGIVFWTLLLSGMLVVLY
jgi:hypothetical protein